MDIKTGTDKKMSDADMILKSIELKKQFGRITPSYLKRKFGISTVHADKIFWIVEEAISKENTTKEYLRWRTLKNQKKNILS